MSFGNERSRKYAKNVIKEILDIETRIIEFFGKMEKKIKRKKLTESDSKTIQKLEKDFKQLQQLKNSVFNHNVIKELQENVDVWSSPNRQSSFAARDGLY